MLPVFIGSDVRSNHVMCAVYVFELHLGDDVQHGHYRALLVEGGNEKMHYCDDGKKPKVFDFDVVAGDVYLILLGRRDA